MKNMMHDRVRFDPGSWTSMLSKALDKYNDAVHSSTMNLYTKMKPKDAHDDKKPLNGEFGCQGEFDKKGKEHWQIPRGECE